MPASFTIICASAIGVVVAPVIAPPLLGLIGFSAAGPVAGSIAATWQASIGNVAAGSVFSTLQGVAMGSTLPAVGKVIGGAVAAGVAALA